jgi:hypothetical protein
MIMPPVAVLLRTTFGFALPDTMHVHACHMGRLPAGWGTCTLDPYLKGTCTHAWSLAVILYRMVSDGGAAGPAGPSATDTSSRRSDDATAAARGTPGGCILLV